MVVSSPEAFDLNDLTISPVVALIKDISYPGSNNSFHL
jgi:hypothetical protein